MKVYKFIPGLRMVRVTMRYTNTEQRAMEMDKVFVFALKTKMPLWEMLKEVEENRYGMWRREGFVTEIVKVEELNPLGGGDEELEIFEEKD